MKNPIFFALVLFFCLSAGAETETPPSPTKTEPAVALKTAEAAPQKAIQEAPVQNEQAKVSAPGCACGENCNCGTQGSCAGSGGAK